jgi:hypothetical protein
LLLAKCGTQVLYFRSQPSLNIFTGKGLVV